MKLAIKSLCVVTHHKTGTVWFRRVFQAVARTQGKQLHLAQRPEDAAKILALIEDGPCFLFAGNGIRPTVLNDCGAVRFVHLVRDPRDVLLSGLSYHLLHAPSPKSPEAIIHSPRERFGGLTYQQKLRSLPNWYAKLRFEMNHIHSRTVKKMLTWERSDYRDIEWRYEDMMNDVEMIRFARMLQKLGYEAEAIGKMSIAFQEESLFGGKSRTARSSQHILSGELQRWKSEFPYKFAQLYAKRFGHALVRLGYEADQTWVESLRDT
jgi:hypothetical protein